MTEIFDAHRFLYHYTDFGGLQGILGSQTIWATHYRSLNDFTEVEHMRGFLERAAFPIVNRVMREDARSSFKYKRFLDKHGGLNACSRQQTRSTIDNLYRTTFEARDTFEGSSFADPFVVSFCAHTTHDDYVKENGLLSMWRAYGNSGGFSLVFDTRHLWDWLKAERERFGYLSFYLADVVYDDEAEKFEEEFGPLTEAIEKFIHYLAQEKNDDNLPDIFQPFFNAVTRFKHRSFKEEREVRLTAAPLSESLARAAIEIVESEGKKAAQKIKPILQRERRGQGVRYIALNDVPNRRPLPIQRVIVGPQLMQTQQASEVKNLTGNRIVVSCSKTPYLPF